MLSLLGKQNSKCGLFHKKTAFFFEEIIKDHSFLKEKINKNLSSMLDGKLQAVFEKLKRENQLAWENSVYHARTNFAEAGGKN